MGNFPWCKVSREHEIKPVKYQRKNFRTWRCPSIIISRSPPCASSTARQRFNAPWLSTKSKQRRSSWAAFLAKCLPWGKLETGSIFHWHEDSAEKHVTQRCGQLLHPAYMKIKTAKISCKAKYSSFAKQCTRNNFLPYGIHCTYMYLYIPAKHWNWYMIEGNLYM